MAILETKTLVEEGIANAYASAENKGATIPERKNIKNLAETIESIQGGGGGTLGATIVDYPFEVADDTIVYTFASSSDDVFVSLSKFDRVETRNGYVSVETLVAGDEVKLLDDNKEVWRSVKQISNSNTDPSVCDVVF